MRLIKLAFVILAILLILAFAAVSVGYLLRTPAVNGRAPIKTPTTRSDNRTVDAQRYRLDAAQSCQWPASELWYSDHRLLETDQRALRKNTSEFTKTVATKLKKARARIETAVREGHPQTAIVDEAKRWGADLIVVGSHGRTGLTRLFMGSVAQSVFSHAPCSVEVVRLRKTRKSR